MGKHSRFVIGICYNENAIPRAEKHSNVNGDIIMHKLHNDGPVWEAEIKAILKVENRWFKKKIFILL